MMGVYNTLKTSGQNLQAKTNKEIPLISKENINEKYLRVDEHGNVFLKKGLEVEVRYVPLNGNIEIAFDTHSSVEINLGYRDRGKYGQYLHLY